MVCVRRSEVSTMLIEINCIVEAAIIEIYLIEIIVGNNLGK
jgi:hypothetical protein